MKRKIIVATLIILVSSTISIAMARDRGVNQPGASGNVHPDSGINQLGPAGNHVSIAILCAFGSLGASGRR